VTTRRLYRQGRCDAMALALHRATGLPLVAIMGERQQPNGRWCREPAHVAVAIPWSENRSGIPRWIDVDGEHKSIPKERLMFLRKPERVQIVPVTEKRVRFMYTRSGVPASQIAEALDFIAKDETLRALVLRYMKP